MLIALDRQRASVPAVVRALEGATVLNAVVEVELRVEAAARRTRVTDDLGPGLERLPPSPERRVADASPPGGTLLDTSAGAPARAGYRVALRRRGDLCLGDVHVRTLGPWGLAWRDTLLPMEERIRVQPGIEELRRERLPGLRPALATVGLRRVRRFGEGSEFESLREYRRGDDPRTIDWKASARRTELLVRNYQVERNQTVVLAIDAGRLMREWIGDRERLDYALGAALVLAERARSNGDRVGVIVFDDRVRNLMPARRVRLSELADTFATVEARLVEPNYPKAFATLGRAFRKRSLIMLFSDVIDAAASRALMNALAGTATRHLPVAIALRNPHVESASNRRTSTRASPYRRAAAEALLEARARALQTMRRAGVHTVDVLPGSVCAATLDKYTEIKRRGML